MTSLNWRSIHFSAVSFFCNRMCELKLSSKPSSWAYFLASSINARRPLPSAFSLRGTCLSFGQSTFLLLYLLCMFHVHFSNIYRIQLSMLLSQLTPPLLCSASTNSLFLCRLDKLILLNCLHFFVFFSCTSRDSNVDYLGLPRLLINEDDVQPFSFNYHIILYIKILQNFEIRIFHYSLWDMFVSLIFPFQSSLPIHFPGSLSATTAMFSPNPLPSCPWHTAHTFFSYHLFSISLFFFFLLHSLASFVPFTVTVPLSTNFLNNTSSEFLTYQLKLFSSPLTRASQLISSPPSSFLDRYIFCSITSWVQLLFIVITFLVIPSMFWSSFFVHLITPPYRNKATVYMFTALILLPPFNLEFIINFSVRRYSYLRVSFISFSFTLSGSIIPRCLYHSSPTFLIVSPLTCRIPSVLISFPLFNTVTLLFCKINPFLYLVRGVGRWIPNY